MTTAAKKTAAKKTASSRSSSTTEQDTSTTQETGADSNKPSGDTRLDYGPGTVGGEPPSEEKTSGTRPPATIVNGDPNAAPLDPPADQHTQTQPPLGYMTSSTDQAYAEAAGRTIAGENHLRLIDEDGNELTADDLFEAVDPNLTFVVTKQRIFEDFTYPNTKRTSGRLLYVKGARVPKFQALRIQKAVSDSAEAGTETSAASPGAGTLKPSAD